MSGDWLSHIAPRGAMFEYAVEYNQQFAHGRHQRHLFRLASCQQPLVEVPDSRVVAADYQRSHVEARTRERPPQTARLPRRVPLSRL